MSAPDKPLGSGRGWVAAQTLLSFAQLFQPLWRPALGLPDLRWGPWFTGAEPWAGGLLALAGVGLAVWASRTLGASLTPLPKPKDESVLVVRGPYRWVRHPIYSAFLLFFAGWALIWKDPALGVLALLLAAVFLFKTRLEERWLVRRYPDYEAYRLRTGRLVPGVHRRPH